MQTIIQQFKISYQYPVIFSEQIFSISNESLANIIKSNHPIPKILVVIEQNINRLYPELQKEITRYFDLKLVIKCTFLETKSGEEAKNDAETITKITDAVNQFGIDRHSYILGIGGGSALDAIGFAATIAHRGIRLIRIPTTVLAQNDAAIGVKNSINAYGKKNFTGTFSPPFAVINDSSFLKTLSIRDWRAGTAEAVKVGLIKDISFFEEIEKNANQLANRQLEPMLQLIYKCAKLHLEHIASGDAFEQGSARPLDFGHWAAHKLEHLSNFEIRHGEAVAIGIALDSIYSYKSKMLSLEELNRILNVLKTLGFELYNAHLMAKNKDNSYVLLKGLQEFREHLGGKLTITLLEKLGKGIEIHEIDEDLMIESLVYLKDISNTPHQSV
ncbi:MAG: 3-dehydroquinate synthase [Bacteroidetes bacterium]|nr:MAG: 3-dehydroquinate synthase [Bacteroidota bacterium]